MTSQLHIVADTEKKTWHKGAETKEIQTSAVPTWAPS